MTTWQTLTARISLYWLLHKHFVRIHRSTIINLEFVERVERSFNYSYDVYLRGVDQPFRMSRRYTAQLKEKMG